VRTPGRQHRTTSASPGAPMNRAKLWCGVPGHPGRRRRHAVAQCPASYAPRRPPPPGRTHGDPSGRWRTSKPTPWSTSCSVSSREARTTSTGRRTWSWRRPLSGAGTLRTGRRQSGRPSACPLSGACTFTREPKSIVQGMYALGRQTVIVSNTSFRDGKRRTRADFEAFGWSAMDQGYVTSVEVGRDKRIRHPSFTPW